MNYSVILVGLFILLLGVIINRFNLFFLVAGYNTMNEEKKKDFNIKAFVSFQEKIFGVAGIIIIVAGVLTERLIKESDAYSLIFIVLMLSVVTVLIYSLKFSKNKQQVSRAIYFMVIVGALIACGIWLGIKTPTYTLTERTFTSTGMYGFTIKNKNIVSVVLEDELVDLQRRVNGFSFMGYNKGYFKSKELGSVKLMVNGKIPVYIHITTATNEHFIFNDSSEAHTRELYEQLRKKVHQ